MEETLLQTKIGRLLKICLLASVESAADLHLAMLKAPSLLN